MRQQESESTAKSTKEKKRDPCTGAGAGVFEEEMNKYRIKKSIVLTQVSGQGKREISLGRGAQLTVVNEYKLQGRTFFELEVCTGVTLTVTDSDLKNSGAFQALSPAGE